MSYNIQINNTVHPIEPVIPASFAPETIPYKEASPVIVQPTKVAKKSKKKKILICCLVTAALVALLIIIAIVVVLVVLLSKPKCRYGEQDGKCIECGLIYSTNRIVGGQSAVSGSWPSIVFIVSKYYYNVGGTKFYYSTICGGTLVNPDTVITAAHCYLRNFQHSGSTITVTTNSYHRTIESIYTVYLGLHDKSRLSSAVRRSIKSYTIHPNYNRINFLNDIAIIKLSSKVKLNNRIQVACLPEDTQMYPKTTNINAFIAGWGTTSFGGTTPNILREASITVYDSSKCNLVSVGVTKNWDYQICAGRYEGGVDSCQGDSGGPLFVRDQVNKKSKFVLAGVTSYGQECALFARPGIYVRVSPYIDWITKKMNEK